MRALKKNKWPIGVLALVAAIAGSVAFAQTPSGPPAAQAQDPPETGPVYALSQRLAAETDRMTLGIAQMRLNAAAAAQPPR